MATTQVCRHGRTLRNGCTECLSPKDWHVHSDIAPISLELANGETRTADMAYRYTHAGNIDGGAWLLLSPAAGWFPIFDYQLAGGTP